MAGAKRPRPGVSTNASGAAKARHTVPTAKRIHIQHPQKRAKQPNSKLPAAPPPVDVCDDDAAVDDDDLEFVASYGRRLEFLTDMDAATLTPTMKPGKTPGSTAPAPPPAQQPASSDDEADYEAVPRSALPDTGPRSAPLPVKGLDGRVRSPLDAPPRRAAPPPTVPGIEVIDPTLSQAPDSEDEEPTQGMTKQERRAARKKAAREAKRAANGDDGHKGAAVRSGGGEGRQAFVSREARQQAARLQMASAAQKLLVDPERNVGGLATLNALLDDSDPLVARWALLSCAAVYKDVLPSYRIRLPTEKELAMPVSKEVRKLREYESALLRGYQTYLKHLLKGARSTNITTVNASLRCMCMLLDAHPAFNYASDLLQLVVANMAHRQLDLATMCCAAVQGLLGADVLGQLSLEAVQLVADLIKKRNCVALRPMVLTSLFALQIDSLQGPVGMGSSPAVKQQRKKKAKHKGKRGDDVDDAFKQASAAPDRDERSRLQSKTLEALFEALFRVIKHAAGSAALTALHAGPLQPAACASKFPLLPAALQGLQQYAHLIDVDYFESLLTVLTTLVNAPRLPVTEKLCVLLAASQLLRGQGQALTLDQQQLYRSLYMALDDIVLALPAQPLPPGIDDEENKDDLHNSAPAHSAAGKHKGITQEVNIAGITAKLLEGMLLDRRALDGGRLLALTKAVARAAVNAPEPGMAAGCLAVLQRMLRRHGVLQGLLEDPSSGPLGTSGPLWGAGADEDDIRAPALQAAMATAPLWELSLLRAHYHPHLAAASHSLVTSGQSAHVLGGAHAPEEAAEAYDTTEGRFRPPPQPPKVGAKASAIDKDADEVAARLEALDGGERPAGDGAVDDAFVWHFRYGMVHKYLYCISCRGDRMCRLYAEHQRLRQAVLLGSQHRKVFRRNT